MLSTITIKNFKCFKKQSFPLGALTLLTGFNATGKSTTIQSLLLVSQALRGGYKNKGVPLNGPLVKLGTVGDVLSQYADSRMITLEFETDKEYLKLELNASSRSKTALAHQQKLSTQQKNSLIENLIKDIIYINATRIGILDVYPIPEDVEPVHADVGDSGQYAPWWFDQYSDDIIEADRLHHKEPAQNLRKQFNAWAGTIFPNSEANTVGIERTPLVRLELRVGLQQQWKRPANIGYGLTYAFPIIVAGLLAKRGQVLIIDSPEAHLHPMGQSRIGYFLGKMASAGVQVIIETHSDHVLNGIRVALTKKELAPEDVLIHFFSPAPEDSFQYTKVITPLVDEEGNLSEWPDGFFDQNDKDLAILSGWEV